MHFATRAMPINDIDGNSHKTEQKSSHNYSTNHTHALVIYGLGGIHTHTHTCILSRTLVIIGNQVGTARRPARAWFKNVINLITVCMLFGTLCNIWWFFICSIARFMWNPTDTIRFVVVRFDLVG